MAVRSITTTVQRIEFVYDPADEQRVLDFINENGFEPPYMNTKLRVNVHTDGKYHLIVEKGIGREDVIWKGGKP